MLISIKRIYIGSGSIEEVMVNTRYIMYIEPPAPRSDRPNTRIVVEPFSHGPDARANMIYTDESIASIKGKITKARNAMGKEEE
jgi:hypothetical protein